MNPEILQTRNYKQEVLDYIKNPGDPRIEPYKEEEMVIAHLLLESLESTELPKEPFDTIEEVSTANKVVQSKWEKLRAIEQLKGKLYPPELNNLPDSLEEKTLLTAPWVNNIHAWIALLNNMNTVRAIQHGQTEFSPALIMELSRRLYISTSLSDPKVYGLRSDQGLKQGKFEETEMRISDTKGVNSRRLVAPLELRIQLAEFNKAFSKG